MTGIVLTPDEGYEYVIIPHINDGMHQCPGSFLEPQERGVYFISGHSMLGGICSVCGLKQEIQQYPLEKFDAISHEKET